MSSNSINFSCPPPSQNVVVDRRVQLVLPVRITLTASGLASGELLLNPNQCCIRSLPAQKAMDTIQMTLNNQSVSQNMSDFVSALEHFNMTNMQKDLDYSKAPMYNTGASQQFKDLFGANRSPMSLYGDGLDGVAAQAFPFTIVSQTNVNGVATSVIDFVTTEYLMLSPLNWSSFKHDQSGFYGLRTFDLTLNFGSPNRMIAIDKDSAGVPLPITPGTWNADVKFGNFSTPFSYTDNQPVLLFQYLTPQLSDKANAMNQVLNYPYVNLERFPTDLGTAPPGVLQTASSNNIQLNSIPSKLYIFLRRKNQELNDTPFHTDSFMQINSVSIQWGNRNGVLASADQRQLYDLAVKSGCTLSYPSWSGQKLNKPALASAGFGTPTQQYSGTGSILALDCLDLGLSEMDAPGKLAQLMLQVQVNYTNVSDEDIAPTLYVVAVSQGVFSLYNGQASAIIGVLSTEDILRCHEQSKDANISYSDVRRMYGGNFLTDVKDKLMSLWKKIGPYIKGAVEVGKTVAQVLPMIGLGEGGGARAGARAGVRAAGAKVPRKRLKNRLK